MPSQKRFTEEETWERKNARQREYQKRTNNEAITRYYKEKTKSYVFSLRLDEDADIINYIEQKRMDNITVADAIRELFDKYFNKHK